MLVSRNGRWDLAFLSTRSPSVASSKAGVEPNQLSNAYYTVGRAEYQFLKSSNVALMVANRSLAGEQSGSVGLDTTMHWTDRVNFTGQLVRAHGPFQNDNWGWFARPSYDSSTGHAHIRYTHLGERFADNANATGFIRDDDRREFDADISKEFWLENGAVQRIVLESRNNIYWSQQNLLRGYHYNEGVEVELRNRWFFSASHLNEYRLFEKGFHNDRVSFNAGYNTREYQSWQIEYEQGKSFDSDLHSVGARIRRKLTPQLSVDYQLSRVWLEPDPEKKATLIHILRFRQNFTRDLYVKAFFQTNSVIDRKNTEFVFVWRHKPPFGAIQFAFQRGRAAFGERSQQGNTYFVKMAHVF